MKKGKENVADEGEWTVFDDFDDDFVENEEQWTAQVACYIDEHIELFATVEEK